MTAAGSTAQADGIKVVSYPGETVEIRGPGKIYRNWLRMEGIKINARPFDDARDQVWWVIGDDNHYYGCEFTNSYWADQTFYDSKGSAVFSAAVRARSATGSRSSAASSATFSGTGSGTSRTGCTAASRTG